MQLRCGNCQLCCVLKEIAVNVHHSEASQYEVYFGNDGTPYIKKDVIGQCIYIRENGCSIYNRRPQVCRSFTCERFLEDDMLKYSEGTIERTIIPLRNAAIDMRARYKRSISRRFNLLLKG